MQISELQTWSSERCISIRWFIAVFTALLSSKKWIVVGGKSLTWSRKKLVCSTFIGFFVSDGTCWIFFFVMTRSSLIHFEISDFDGRSAGWTIPSNKMLCCSSDLVMLGLQSFHFSLNIVPHLPRGVSWKQRPQRPLRPQNLKTKTPHIFQSSEITTSRSPMRLKVERWRQ